MSDLKKLSGRQRRHLRSLAHGLKPLVQVGKNGLNDGLLQNLDDALAHHELVKVRFTDGLDQKEETCDRIDRRLGCARIGMVGHVAIFYRPAKDPAARRIELPVPSW